MNITILGAHNRESRDTKLVSLLIDDSIALDASAVTSSLSFNAQLRLKAVLLTHRHYDHIRDMPMLAMNFFLSGATLPVYSTPSVQEALTDYLLNGQLYPDLLSRPEESPTVRFTPMASYEEVKILGYRVMAAPVVHAVPAVGYQMTSPEGKSLFYTGDTGPGLNECWQHISPQLLIIDTTVPDRYEEFGRKSGHLTPGLLKMELVAFREVRGYVPHVVLVHINPELEAEVRSEAAAVAGALGVQITPAYEGMQLQL